MSEVGGQKGATGGEDAGQGVGERAALQAGPAERGQGGYVLDASALLCLINGEPGAERVAAVLPASVISTVNLTEVATKLDDLGAGVDEARALLAPLHLAVVPLGEGAALAAGALRTATRAYGLSLADRVCLALAAERGATALTADRAWRDAGEAAGATAELLRYP